MLFQTLITAATNADNQKRVKSSAISISHVHHTNCYSSNGIADESHDNLLIALRAKTFYDFVFFERIATVTDSCIGIRDMVKAAIHISIAIIRDCRARTPTDNVLDASSWDTSSVIVLRSVNILHD